MSRSAAVLVALTVTASVAGAQQPRGGVAASRALLARADSLWADLARRDSAAHERTYLLRRARRADAGALAVLLPSSAGTETAVRIAAGASAFLDGVVPAEFERRYVVVANSASGADSVLRAEGLTSRARLPAEVAPQPDSLANGWPVAIAVAWAYLQTLDTTWRAWLPIPLPIGWTMPRNGRAAVRELMGGEVRSGADCLGGGAAGCRRWLGLDADSNPYRSRYRPAELRRAIGNRWFFNGEADMRALVRQCADGSDEACVSAAPRVVPAVPAGFEARASLLAFVRARQPAGALQRALADSSGALGARLARATRLSEDSLVGAWRIWLLTGGGLPRVRAGLRDALPVVLFAGLLLLAASRSGRWR